MAKKKQKSNAAGLVLLGLIALGVYHFGISGIQGKRESAKPQSAHTVGGTQTFASSVPLNQPRYVNVAALNVRHTPSTSGPLITVLPRGTPLKVLDRRDGWLLVDLSATLEGWVAEGLTTTQNPKPVYVPPTPLKGSR